MNDLDRFIASISKSIVDFEAMWLSGHHQNPEQYPLSLPGNSGVWLECFMDYFNDEHSDENIQASHCSLNTHSLDDTDGLAFFIAGLTRDAKGFEQDWLNKHSSNPNRYPLTIPENNTGILWELFIDYTCSNPGDAQMTHSHLLNNTP